MVTFVTQMVLIVLLVMGMDLSEFGSQPPSLVVSVMVSFIVINIAREQRDNYNAMRDTFPLQMYRPMMLMDWFVNKVVAGFVVIINFLLLGTTTEYLDLVLNSTAILFIIELDDVALSVDQEDIIDCLRSTNYRLINERLQAHDPRYWSVDALRNSRPKVNLEHAALIWED
jgi:hypothetical protein